MVGLKDVAEYAGVSASTVSRVLAGKSYVNDNTRKEVWEAIKALDYRPNALAQSLKNGISNTIALMIPSIQNLMFPDIVRGVEDAARKAGYTVVLCNTDEDIAVEEKYIDTLRTHLIGGFIVASMTPDSKHILRLRDEGVPLVLTSRSYDMETDAVIIDNEQAGFDATSYLLRTGHRRIALALGRTKLPIYADRLEGYKRALAQAGIPFDESLVMRESNGMSSFYALVRKLLRSGPRPDAIFATSDPKAFVVMRALYDEGLRIPEDISVIGLDNVEMSALVEPPLTTVSQPLYEMGKLAAQKLFAQIRYKEEHNCLPPAQVDVMRTELILRKSTR